MISLKQLAKTLEQGLNENTKGFDFSIVADTGKFKKAKREGNLITFYTNGVLTTLDSEASNLTDGTVFATMTCSLKFIVEIRNPNEDVSIDNAVINNSTKTIGDLREVLDNYFQANTQATMIDSNGKEYLVVGTYQFANSGIREQVQIVGNSYTLSINLFYMFIEGGISNFEVIYTLDGFTIPFQANTANDTPTIDGYVPANTKNGATLNLMSQHTWSVSFELPALRNAVTKAIFNSIFKRKVNQAHILSIVKPSFVGLETEEEMRMVFIAESSAMGETIKNIGMRATLLDAYDDYELVNFNDNIKVFEVSRDANSITFVKDTYLYNYTSREYAHTTANVSYPIDLSSGDIIVATSLPSGPNYNIIQGL